ncbi:MAG: DUF2141 domain-containing protein [Spirochaetales bacterium]|nr:DUF2141 domain-containing protein [Spirochaetales bacterium]
MKKLLILLPVTICFLFALWAEKSESTLYITIKGLRNDNGKVLLALYDSEAGFPEDAEKAVDKAAVSIRNGKAQAVFNLNRSGTYAVCVMHDENNNGSMDKGLFGIPLEGYGFSNDAMGVMSAPPFKDAAVKLVGSEKHIVINIVY